MFSNCGAGEGSWGSLGQQGDQTKSVPNTHWKNWCWSWHPNTLATSCKELTHLKRPWCWERLRAGGEGDNRGWDGWMTSLTQWTWVWVDSGTWCWSGRPGMLQFMGLQRVGQNWATELNWGCVLAWKIPWTEEPSGLQSMESQKSWTQLSNFKKKQSCSATQLHSFLQCLKVLIVLHPHPHSVQSILAFLFSV